MKKIYCDDLILLYPNSNNHLILILHPGPYIKGDPTIIDGAVITIDDDVINIKGGVCTKIWHRDVAFYKDGAKKKWNADSNNIPMLDQTIKIGHIEYALEGRYNKYVKRNRFMKMCCGSEGYSLEGRYCGEYIHPLAKMNPINYTHCGNWTIMENSPFGPLTIDMYNWFYELTPTREVVNYYVED